MIVPKPLAIGRWRCAWRASSKASQQRLGNHIKVNRASDLSKHDDIGIAQCQRREYTHYTIFCQKLEVFSGFFIGPTVNLMRRNDHHVWANHSDELVEADFLDLTIVSKLIIHALQGFGDRNFMNIGIEP